MSIRSYSEIRDQIGRELGDLTAPAAREAVIEHLTELTFELSRIKEQQRTLLAALRARDILLRDHEETGTAGPAGPIELDPRDALDTADGLYDIEWDNEIAYRWTGPGHDTLFRVWLDRALPVVCEIALLSYGDGRNRSAVGLTVDGVPVAIEEAGDKLLRSASFPVVGGSLYSEIGIHVPWLTGAAALEDGAAEGRPGGGRRGRRPRAARGAAADGAADGRVRGIAFTRMRFLAPA
jgi:hypothetical protein